MSTQELLSVDQQEAVSARAFWPSSWCAQCAQRQPGRVRFHYLRHTFATLALSAGEHYMQVSKWLGHSSYVLTLTTYADYISEDEPVPPRLARPITAKRGHNVVTLDRTAL